MSVFVKVITFFLVSIGMFIPSSFAQQFEEPNYDIRGGKVLGFEIDSKTTSLVISLDARTRGELTITLPRYLIDAKTGSEDIDFSILVSGIKLNFFDETATPADRTITIPFGRSDFEIIITGTHVLAQTPPAQITQSQQIEKIIESELKSEILEGKAKLLIFSNTEWFGALQSSSFNYSEISGQGDTSFIFGCEPPFGGEGVFGAKIQKTTPEGYLKIVAIQNQKIMSQGSTEAAFGEVFLNGNCVSSFDTGTGGCLIATATYGSEMAPQVQQLRELRDTTILSTASGSAFMAGFNQLYYSFSPTIADMERENPLFKEIVKTALTPMLTSLTLLNYVDIDSEQEMLGYGIGIISLNIGMYFVAPAMVILGIRKTIQKDKREFRQ